MIHYHGSPCSGNAESVGRFYSRRHAMVSFAHHEQLPVIADVCQSFVLDNGAFSAWRSGVAFDVPGYKSFVSEWESHPGFDWALIPDVIDGTADDNDAMIYDWLATMTATGVPVWHFHESAARLVSLCENHSRVALGSSGQWPNPGSESWWDRLAEVMSHIVDECGRPIAKLHGLRMLNPAIFTRVPFSSADSTNAAQNAGSVTRFGMYTPPDAWQRANVIADRIEAYNSAATWQPAETTAQALFA